jgi:murein L,D-transpeptidase YcbB/YkuD
MRYPRSKNMSRRQILSGLAAMGMGAALAPVANAQDSLTDMIARNRVLRKTDREGNTAAALNAIDTIEPILSFDTAYNLQLAIMQYEKIVAAGGWKEMPREVHGLVAGNDRNSVSRLRERLIQSGDIPEEFASRKDLFDQHMDAGVRQFQARHGLLVSGKVDAETYYALNVPADYRLNQLRLNAARVESLAAKLSDSYVVVNIPAAVIEAIDNGTVARRHTAIVGRIDRPTPILSSRIHQINFNPYWNVPKSIIRRDLIKYMNEDPDYLTNYRIRIFDGKGNELLPTDIDWNTEEAVNYSFRQDPGAENSMGHVKINFHNKHAVYLHDTPTKSLFGENRRFHSSGCVRVDDVDAMVAWLLRGNGEWDLASVQAMFNSGERVDVAIKNPVPIHTTYISAWANRQGIVSFREDVYEFDKNGRVTFET